MIQIEKEDLRVIGGSKLDVYMSMLDGARVKYQIWRDGSSVHIYAIYSDNRDYLVTVCFTFDLSTGIGVYTSTEVESK